MSLRCTGVASCYTSGVEINEAVNGAVEFVFGGCGEGGCVFYDVVEIAVTKLADCESDA